MALSEETVHEVLQRLMQRKYVNGITQAGARVTKYEHRMRIKWSLEQDKLAVLTILMLRGLQTAGEIRTRSGRLHEFKSVAEVEAGLQFLIDKYPPLVAQAGAGARHQGAALRPAAGRRRSAGAAGDGVRHRWRRQRPEQGSRVGPAGTGSAQLRSEVDDLTAQFDEFRKQFE